MKGLVVSVNNIADKIYLLEPDNFSLGTRHTTVAWFDGEGNYLEKTYKFNNPENTMEHFKIGEVVLVLDENIEKFSPIRMFDKNDIDLMRIYSRYLKEEKKRIEQTFTKDDVLNGVLRRRAS